MRENRQSGSEGGGAGNEPALPTPIDNQKEFTWGGHKGRPDL